MGPGTLNRTVRRLEETGLIAESGVRPDEDDPRRRYSAITALGRDATAAEARRLDVLLSEARVGKLIP